MQHRKRLPWLICALAALWLVAMAAHAEVRLPNSEYTTTVEDFKVKVLGGYVTIARSWTNGRWYANPEWGDLKFTYDSLDGSVKGIERVGTIYERSSAGLFLYKVDQPFYIQQTASGWRWYDTKGNWITYDANGHLTAYGDRNNVKVNFTLDGNGHPTQVTDNFGQPVLSFQYNGDQLTGVTDRVGRQVRYQYTGANLTQVTDVLGNTSTYTYDANGQITSLTDQEGHATTIVYAQSTPGNSGSAAIVAKASDASASASVASTGPTPRAYKIAKVFTVTDPEGNTTTYLYDYDRIAQRFTVTQKFPGGRTIIGVYDALGRLRQQTVGTRIVMTMTRDGDRTEMIADERGLITTTVFDGAWNPIKITYPDGTSVSATYDSVYSNVLSKTDEAGTQTTFQYDAKGNPLAMTEAVGFPEQRTTTYSYDQYGQRLTITRKGATAVDDATTAYSYDALGNLVTMTDPVGNKAQYLSYDVIGNVLSVQDPRGNTWTRTYNPRGWPVTQADPLGHSTTYTYDKVGNRTKIADALNNSTTLAYDKDDRLITLTDALGGITQYQYDPEGRKIKLIDPNNVTMTYGYDGDGRPTTVTDGNGSVTTTAYGDNANGLNGLIVSVAYPTYSEQYKYDVRNRITQVTQVLDASTSYVTSNSYDARGDLISITDALGRTTQFSYDPFDRRIATTDALASTTRYVYDSRDNLINVTDANSHTTIYDFDKANRQIATTRPLGETTNYAYDANGNLTIRINAKGEQRRFTYDSSNRATREEQYSVVNGTLAVSPSKVITFTFDARNQLVAYDAGDTSAMYTFDALRHKLSETMNYGGFSKTFAQSYFPNGRSKTFTYADGTIVSYDYNSADQLKTIVTPGGTISFNTYRWRVPLQITMPGATRTLNYDGLLRPTQIVVENGQAGSGQMVMNHRYSYDAMSNILQNMTEDGLYDYKYDSRDRLLQATPPANLQVSSSNPSGLPLEQYSYDAAHNRLTSAHQPGAWLYNADDQLTQFGAGSNLTNMAYDTNGQTVRRSVFGTDSNYRYDVAERLSAIADASNVDVVTYAYDPFGRRIKKTDNGVTTFFQYSDQGLIAEFDAAGNLGRIYGWRPGSTLGGAPQFLVAAQTYYFYQTDSTKTPRLLLDSAGNKVWSILKTAFGESLSESGTIPNALSFAGQYRDNESGYHYNAFRDYWPSTGRYLESDPIGQFNGTNTYTYVQGNAVNRADPTGLAGGPPAWGSPPIRLAPQPYPGWNIRPPPPRLPINPVTPVRPPGVNPPERSPYDHEKDWFEELPDPSKPGECINVLFGCPPKRIEYPGWNCWFDCPTPPLSCTRDNPSGRCQLTCTRMDFIPPLPEDEIPPLPPPGAKIVRIDSLEFA